MTGIRTEEARAVRWDHVQAWTGRDGGWRPVTDVGFDHERFAICVWRPVRVNGDTKTEKSRRALELPDEAVAALKEHRARQAARRLEAGELGQDHGLVFCSQSGTPLDPRNVRRAFRGITKAAGLGKTWGPRELRHTFVSIMSDSDVPVEKIADLVGHEGTLVTERVYRHQLKPVITKGAEASAIQAVVGPEVLALMTRTASRSASSHRRVSNCHRPDPRADRAEHLRHDAGRPRDRGQLERVAQVGLQVELAPDPPDRWL
jgi:hypothetical protein